MVGHGAAAHEFCRRLLEIRVYRAHLVQLTSRHKLAYHDVEPNIEFFECGEWPAAGGTVIALTDPVDPVCPL